MSTPANARSESRRYATFSVADMFCGIDVAQVQEVLKYQEMTPVPLAPDVIASPFLAHNHTPENLPLEAALSISAFHDSTAAGWVSRWGTGTRRAS